MWHREVCLWLISALVTGCYADSLHLSVSTSLVLSTLTVMSPRSRPLWRHPTHRSVGVYYFYHTICPDIHCLNSAINYLWFYWSFYLPISFNIVRFCKKMQTSSNNWKNGCFSYHFECQRRRSPSFDIYHIKSPMREISISWVCATLWRLLTKNATDIDRHWHFTWVFQEMAISTPKTQSINCTQQFGKDYVIRMTKLMQSSPQFGGKPCRLVRPKTVIMPRIKYFENSAVSFDA